MLKGKLTDNLSLWVRLLIFAGHSIAFLFFVKEAYHLSLQSAYSWTGANEQYNFLALILFFPMVLIFQPWLANISDRCGSHFVLFCF